jgi:hypothetical protein
LKKGSLPGERNGKKQAHRQQPDGDEGNYCPCVADVVVNLATKDRPDWRSQDEFVSKKQFALERNIPLEPVEGGEDQ